MNANSIKMQLFRALQPGTLNVEPLNLGGTLTHHPLFCHICPPELRLDVIVQPLRHQVTKVSYNFTDAAFNKRQVKINKKTLCIHREDESQKPASNRSR